MATPVPIVAASAQSSIQFWLQIDGFFTNTHEGPVAGSPVPNAVKLSTFTLPASLLIAPGGGGVGSGGVGRPTLGPVTFSRPIDSSSPQLLLQMLQIKPIANITVTAILPAKTPSATAHDRITYTFKNAFLTSWAHDGTVAERLTVSFSAVTLSYLAGNVVEGMKWDISTNSGGEFQS